ncbi:uncharacterized protein LOC123222803 [Mangifera indica]|uniref:uncharacterized protein LOC123222803 n=1 Tax=Mangifera indica TaxID=29780 RepID=UPI001CFA28CA|nr:uncharacterized protein LOC123222803 [Mangifera indica]
MMGSLSEEDDQFFDTREDMSTMSDSGSNSPEHMDSDLGVDNILPIGFGYEIWIKNPSSIQERRDKLLKWMGICADQTGRENSGNGITSCNVVEVEIDRHAKKSDAVLGSSSFDDGLSWSLSSMSCWSGDDRELFGGATEENFVCQIRNLDDGSEFIVDEIGQDGMLGSLREAGSNRLITVEEFERNLGLSPLVQQVMQKDVEDVENLGAARKQVMKGWWRRLGSVACIVDGSMIANDSHSISRARTQKVRVRSHRKRSKELSALYIGQDIQAHQGSILTMKFSSNGQFLASGGEDGIVRVWQVVESERSGNFDAADCDASCVYFTMNNLSEFVPVCTDKESEGKLKGVRKTSNSACAIFPQKVFQILERPIHEFLGHCGEVLDLSWSRNKYLLSSSVDKTVRLWQVGCDQCLEVFFHNNYVSCVQFNPVDDNYFISGSIDGKVRLWAIPGCQVVDWTDITEIVTAICFRPDGMGVVVGSMSDTCRFYDASDDCLQLYAQVCLQSKKKSPLKRITSMQFSPGDSTKMMVTSADSQVRILHRIDTICQFRGLQNTGSQISASFTSDGKHAISASDDSNVYMWNYDSHDRPVPQTKKNWSCEHFFSNNVSVAIPWCGITCGNNIFSSLSGASAFFGVPDNLWECSEKRPPQSELGESSQCKLPLSSHEHFPLNHRKQFSKSLPKGSATWPEEKLVLPSSMIVSSAMGKSQYKFLKTSLQSTHGFPHAWGLVITTAGWDGRIRSFQNYGLPIFL